MTNRFSNFEGNNLDNFLGHEMIEIKENYVKSKLKIEDHHKQPMGLVHGGIYATLSETICSYGANFLDGGVYVGVNNNTDFLTSVETGEIICIAEPIKVGRSYQLWESKIYHNDKLCAVSKVRLSKIK
jgi:uncharacterized protein (TIGR00369 family)|tara:strand:+ start:1934 stop:2317 length:384 start_codon:yes stop_codon:yes gene_type:complete